MDHPKDEFKPDVRFVFNTDLTISFTEQISEPIEGFMNTLHGEFDPGSGRTLAACLTHASRTELNSLL